MLESVVESVAQDSSVAAVDAAFGNATVIFNEAVFGLLKPSRKTTLKSEIVYLNQT